MTEQSKYDPDTPVDENEVAPPSGAPEALTNPDVDEIQAAEAPEEEDPYQLRSGVQQGGGDATDPASQMNF